MERNFGYFLILLTSIQACSGPSINQPKLSGIKEPVEIIRDQWGINHIYANNQRDLFFAQGYCAAKDRLFQFEVWRRQATGTVAELLGERELKRDIGTRLFKFRGDMKTEMNHYHPQGEEIITAYVDGVNAYINEVLADTTLLPIEFKLLKTLPQHWTPEVVISRHQGLLGNITYELDFGRAVAKVGADKVKEIMWFHPKDPDLTLDPSLTSEILEQDILELYNAYRAQVKFLPEDLNAKTINKTAYHSNQPTRLDWTDVGSNNWVVSGQKTESGFPIMANDPHRRIAAPSLRYMVHLVAPGWNVIGGGEPEIPGISIGHNGVGAWGLTVFETDGEDLYVYDLNPENLNQYKYKDEWVNMNIITESIPIKNSSDTTVQLLYTKHGPVTFIDSVHHKAFAVRCAWQEPGGSPYLASLRMNQAQTWEEFREACSYSHIPGENMIWADKSGNIGWQAVGIAPVRKNFSGMVPVPGDGRFEWDGYLPIKEKPHDANPTSGFIATANQNVTPGSYTHWDAISFEWADPFRGDRINSVLTENKKFTMAEMQALQTDNYTLPAKTLAPLLLDLSFDDARIKAAQEKLLNWNFVLDKNSIPAAIYSEWENAMMAEARDQFIPESIRGEVYLQLNKLLIWIENPEKRFGKEPIKNRGAFLKKSFTTAVQTLSNRLGEDMNQWQYGQEKNKHITIQHPFSNAVQKDYPIQFSVGPVPRGGSRYTPNSSGGNLNQSSGASFRIIVDTGDWEKSVAINTPGQSGDPTSPFYKNLFDLWANDEYFPLYYSREVVEKNQVENVMLNPK